MRASMPFVNDTKPSNPTTLLIAGSPIGLLLTLTYAMNIGFSNDTKPSSSFSNDTKPSGSYSNDLKP